jgi:hypothetical protein
MLYCLSTIDFSHHFTGSYLGIEIFVNKEVLVGSHSASVMKSYLCARPMRQFLGSNWCQSLSPDAIGVIPPMGRDLDALFQNLAIFLAI